MDFIKIPVSPKVAEALKKSKGLIDLVSAFNAKLLDALTDNKLSWDELLALFAMIVNIGRTLIKK